MVENVPLSLGIGQIVGQSFVTLAEGAFTRSLGVEALNPADAGDLVLQGGELVAVCDVALILTKVTLGAAVTVQVVATGIIGPVEWLAVAGVDEEVLGALGEAVASVEAKLAEQGHFLQVDNHVFHQLKLADHLFLLFGKFRSTDW